MQRPSVSAVVVNHDGGEAVLGALDSLHRQDTPLEEIVVVDSGSTDGSPQRIRAGYPHVAVIELGENLGPAVARNTGLRRVRSELVLVMDDDVRLQRGALLYLLEAYEREQPVLICPRLVLFPEVDRVHCDGAEPHFVGTLGLRHGYQPIAGLSATAVSVGGCISACMLLRREQALAVGSFDETYFFYFEDLEFSLRLRGLGHRIVCEPRAIAYHDRGAGTAELSFRGRGVYPLRRARLSLRNRWLTMLIHYRLRTFLVLLPALALYELAALATVLLRGWGGTAREALVWLVRNQDLIQQRRAYVQAARRLPDRDLLAGGALPIAPGFARNGWERGMVRALSVLLSAYWQAAKGWID